MENELQKVYKDERRWTNWRFEKLGEKITKVPYFSKGKKSSSTDPETWKTFDEAETDLNNGSNKFDGLGIVFTPDMLLLGIDIDHCLIDRKLAPDFEGIQMVLDDANTYTEISPSDTGLHLFIKLSEPLPLEAHKKAPFEVYTAGRYFTVTGDTFGEAKPVRTMTAAEALELLENIGYPWKAADGETREQRYVELDDQAVLDKMFSSKNGEEIRALYNGSLAQYDNDESRADAALVSHFAFWTGRNAAQMEGLWLAAPLAQRPKTLKRKDYRDRTIKKAIMLCKEIYEAPYMKVIAANPEIEFLFTVNAKGDKIILQNTENICRVLRHRDEFRGRFRYDEFKNNYEFESKEKKWRILEDNDAVDIQTHIQILFSVFGKVGKEMVYDAIIKVCKENRFDSATDYIKALVWDKKDRLSTWLTEVYGVPDDKYHKAVGANWLKGLVKRIVEPGCKFDYVLVLEGPQGSRKSTSLHVLGGDWHVETAMSTESKDFFMQMQGKAIVEFSEGETLNRTEVKRMKAIITTQSDKYRPPYERSSQDFPRRCVFAMTTNQEEYLKDETGNRRWLPVKVVFDEAKTEWLAEFREQLFAEAYHRVVNIREKIYEFPKEETLAAQNARRITDPNTDLIVDWYYRKVKAIEKENGITVHMAWRDALNGGMGSKAMTRAEEMAIAGVYKDNLGLTKVRKMVDGVQGSRWTATTLQLEEAAQIEVVDEWGAFASNK